MTSLPTWLTIASICSGLLFAFFPVAVAIASLRLARSRDQRLEAAGAAVPGTAGLLLAAAAMAAPSLASVVLFLLALPIIVLGRKVYELLVFR